LDEKSCDVGPYENLRDGKRRDKEKFGGTKERSEVGEQDIFPGNEGARREHNEKVFGDEDA
jgi:hypothetical protein